MEFLIDQKTIYSVPFVKSFKVSCPVFLTTERHEVNSLDNTVVIMKVGNLYNVGGFSSFSFIPTAN